MAEFWLLLVYIQHEPKGATFRGIDRKASHSFKKGGFIFCSTVQKKPI